MKRWLLILALGVGFWNGCKKDAPPDPVDNTTNNSSNNNNNNNTTPPPTGSAVKLSFKNVVGADPLVLGSPLRYVNLNGDSFYVNLYKYYISNIVLTDINGNEWAEPESYHLINQSDTNSLNFYIRNVPDGIYTGMRFMIGVDSARNVSGTQTGALDPDNGMFWTWNTGYIMAKFEGKAPRSTAAADNVIFHIGGFGGATASQRIASPSFNATNLLITSTTVPVIHINSDVLEWFKTPNNIDFSVLNLATTPGADVMMIADNYADMFTITGIDN